MIAQENTQNAQPEAPTPTAAAGLTPEQDLALHLLCTRLLGERTGRSDLYQLARGTVAQFRPPPPLPQARRVMRRLRLAPEELDRRWAIAEATTGLLDRSLINEFLPEDAVWADLWRLVEEGPSRWGHRVARLMKLWANGAEIDGSSRVRLKAATLNTYIVTQLRLVERILELRNWAENEGVDLPADFDQWSKVDIPSLKWGDDYGGAPSNVSTKAPTLLHTRRALKGLDARVSARTRRNVGHRVVRWRALLGGFTSTGGRSDTLAWMLGEDYIPAHQFPDGTCGPAYRFRRLKGKPGVERIQGVPDIVGTWTEMHIDYNAVQPWESLWAERERDMLSASPGALSGTIDTIMALYADPGDEDAYTSHDIRRVVERCARRYGDRMLGSGLDIDDEVMGVVGFVPDGQTLADILVDHRPAKIDATYKDLLNPVAVEHWSRVAALGVWEYVWGELGARRVPDLDAMARAHERLRDAEADRTVVKNALGTVKRRRTELRAERTRVLASGLDERSIRTRLNDLFDELETLSEAADELADKASAAGEAVAQARQVATDAVAATVPINDFASDREVHEIRTAAASYTELAATDAPRIEPPLRRSFTSSEFAWATGVSRAQMRRYFRGESGYQCLFDTSPDGSVAGVEFVTDRRRFAHFDALPLDRYPVRIIERLQWLMRQPHGTALPSSDPAERSEDVDLRVGLMTDARAVLAGSLTAVEVARKLGVSLPTPMNRARSNRLLAIEDRGHQLFPSWQFDESGPGVIPGLTEILVGLGDLDPAAKATWFITPKNEFNGCSPLEKIQSGEVSAAVALAGGPSTWTPTLNQKETAALLGVSATMPKHRAKRGLLLALDDEETLKFPTWQFDVSRPSRTLAGLAEVLAALDPLAAREKNAWFQTENAHLGGRAPATALAEGDTSAVLAAAAAPNARAQRALRQTWPRPEPPATAPRVVG